VLINGTHIADAVRTELENERKMFGELTLGVLMSAGDAATESFIRIKSRVAQSLDVSIVRKELSADATTAEALVALKELAATCDGVIVQLPLPKGVDVSRLIDALPPEKDVDGLTKGARVRPPVAVAVQEILTRNDVSVKGARAVVVGAGKLVGLPSAALLQELGAEVAVLSKGDSLEALKDADIVVLGAGEPGLVKPEMLKQGVVLIDAGTSEQSGKLKGDADPACGSVASIYTPVPGGVGPIAVVMIFKNLLALARQAQI